MGKITPLKILGILSLIYALAVSVLTYGYLIVLGLIFIGFGILLFVLDKLTRKIRNKNYYWSSQIFLSVVYCLCLSYAYLEWSKYNLIVFPNNFKGEAGIVFGIKGYPELPEMEFWKRKITLSESGVLITSTMENEIPASFRFKYANGEPINASTLKASFSDIYPCIITNSGLKYYSFHIGENASSTFQKKLSELCNLINQNKLISKYKPVYSPIMSDVEVPYIDLQNRNLSHLPDNFQKLAVKEVILTGNDFNEFPEQLFKMPYLETLHIGHNPIEQLPTDLSKLRNLKRLHINKTAIKKFPDDLSKLKNLESIGLDHNEYEEVPEAIMTLPNLKRLGFNNNNLKNLSFVDTRLQKLESLYLYSNEITRIGCEIQHLKNLNELLIFDNKIDSIPDCIGDLSNLEKLEIWNNPINWVSPKISKLTNLRYLRMDDDFLSEEEKEQIKKWLPNTQVEFQTRNEK